MACFTKTHQRNGTNCEFEKCVTTSNFFVLNSLDKSHLNFVLKCMPMNSKFFVGINSHNWSANPSEDCFCCKLTGGPNFGWTEAFFCEADFGAACVSVLKCAISPLYWGVWFPHYLDLLVKLLKVWSTVGLKLLWQLKPLLCKTPETWSWLVLWRLSHVHHIGRNLFQPRSH